MKMRGMPGAVSICSLAMACVLLASTPAQAVQETVRVDFDLTGAGNTLDLTVNLDSIVDDSQSDTASVTGNLLADVLIDFNSITHEGTILGIELIDRNTPGGSHVLLSDTSFSLVSGLVTINATGIAGTVSTPAPPAAVVGNNFDASLHTALIDTGLVEATGLVSQSIDLASSPVTSALSGTGTSSLSINSIVGGLVTYDIGFSLPISFASEVYNQDGTVVTIEVAGTISDSAQFTRIIPEPASLALLGVGALLLARRRR